MPNRLKEINLFPSIIKRRTFKQFLRLTVISTRVLKVFWSSSGRVSYKKACITVSRAVPCGSVRFRAVP